MDVHLFDFDLPDELIAQTPLADRTGSRLMTLDKQTGEIGHRQFSDFIDLLQPGDALVINDTKVIPARLYGMKPDTGAKIEVLLLKRLAGDRWEALVKPGKRLKPGATIVFGNVQEGHKPLLTAEVVEEGEAGARVLDLKYDGIFHEILDQLGQMPLPPYIKEQLAERDRYQTVYARHEGSAAAPTAGLHFNEAYLADIAAKGVTIVPITLHVGLGTFRPVMTDTIEEHEMHAEYYHVGEEAAAALSRTKAQGGRIVAVGTTSARTLETLAQSSRDNVIQASSGWTNIFLYPGSAFHLVDALLTNFHLPKSTLVMLVSALAGREATLSAYREAVENKYRFFSFGDAMFIY